MDYPAAYTASAHSHWVHYVGDELRVHADKVASRLEDRGLSSPLLRDVVAHAVLLIAHTIVYSWGKLARGCEFDRAVYVNNWLLSTSLPPHALVHATDGRAMRAELHALTHSLLLSHPDHALVYRCVDMRGSAQLMTTLSSLGWQPVPARYVHYQDVHDPALWRRSEAAPVLFPPRPPFLP